MRTLLGREDNFTGPHTFKWLFDGFTCGLRVRVGFRVRHLILMVRVIIKGLGNALCLCVLTKIEAHCGTLMPDAEGSSPDVMKMLNEGNSLLTCGCKIKMRNGKMWMRSLIAYRGGPTLRETSYAVWHNTYWQRSGSVHSLPGWSAHRCCGCIITHRVPVAAMTLMEDTCWGPLPHWTYPWTQISPDNMGSRLK